MPNNKMKRNIIEIDEGLCNGCGLCIPNCHEGALRIIDGKARLISDLFCDGLGACLGHCPEGAITIIEREAEPYDERKVMEQIVPQGRNTILAHLDHLRDHNETGFLDLAIRYLKEKGIDMSPDAGTRKNQKSNQEKVCSSPAEALNTPSELKQWPVQLHLLNPQASYFRDADVVLAADCVAFAVGDFHNRFLKGKSLAIACPKLDTNKESYVQKLTSMITDTRINSLSVVMMEVPCCGGLLGMADAARKQAGRNIPLKKVIVTIRGEALAEEAVE